VKKQFLDLVAEARRMCPSLIGIEETNNLQIAGYCYVFEDRKTLIKIKNYHLPEEEEYTRKITVLFHELQHVQDIESNRPTDEVSAHCYVLEQCQLRGFTGSFKFYRAWLEWLSANGNPDDSTAAQRALT
jgi:hypothetical protein